MRIVKLIFKIIFATIVVVICYPFVIILTPVVIIFWAHLSDKIKKGAFTIFKHFEPHDQKEFKETVVSEETIQDEPNAK